MICLRSQPPPTAVPSVAHVRLQPPIRRVLASISLSHRNSAVAAEAAQVAQSHGAELHIVHAGSPSTALRRYMTLMMARAGVPPDTPVTVRGGRADRVVCDAATETGADLIVAGVMRKDTTLAEHASSTAGRIVVGAPCHVLLVREPRLEPTPPQRMMAAVGFDLASRAMLEWSTAWARVVGAKVFDVVHEYDPRGFYSLTGVSAQNDDAMAGQSAAARRDALAAFLREYNWSGLRLTQMCLRSNSGCDALWYAGLMSADLLCVPVTPRRVSYWRRLIGHRLAVNLYALPCSVLFFKP